MGKIAGDMILDRRAGRVALPGRTRPGQAAPQYGRHDRYWIPLNHPHAVRFYTEHLFVPHSRQELLRGAVARAMPAASPRMLPIRNGPETTLSATAAASPELMALIERSLPRTRRASGDALWPLILGPYQRSGRGQSILLLFEGASVRPVALAKVAHAADQRAQLQQEHDALTTLQARLDPLMRSTVPAPLALIRTETLTVLLETVLPGRSMYRDLRNSWQPQALAARHLRLAQEWLVRFQRSTLASDGPADEALIREQVIAPLERHAPRSTRERQMIEQAIETAHRLRGERLPLVAQQGDFWPRNLLVHGGRVGVVDWERFHPCCAPFADLLMFATSYGLSYPWRWGRWADPVAAFRATYLSRSWLARCVRELVHSHCRRMQVTPAWLDVFFPVFLAQQVSQAQPAALDDEHTSGRQLWTQLIGEYAHQGGSACFG